MPGEEIIDLQFAANVVKEKLPGWCWKVCTCCVSDDAWVAPDFNDPVHGPRLHAELDPVAFDSHFDSGFDVDRRPPGNAGQALLDAVDLALRARAWRRLGPIPTDPVLEEKLSRVEYDDGYVGPGD